MAAPVHLLFAKKETLEKTDPAAAIKSYLTVLKEHPYSTTTYNRLMILYRKQKEREKEIALIQKAIERFESFYSKHQPVHSKEITRLSKALSLSTGLATRKGDMLYEPEPIATWRKRLATIKQKKKIK